MSNYVLKRVESVKLGAVGADEAACTDLGSVRELELTISQSEDKATSALYGDAVVEVALSGTEAAVRVVGEEITYANLVYALNGTSNDSGVEFDGTGGTPDYFTLYARGFAADGSAALLHACKCYIKPEVGLKLGKEQQLLEMTATLMVDPGATTDYKMLRLGPAAADTTAPTITTVSPADAATSVAKAITTLVEVTFSEAVRTEDINDETFFVHAADGTMKAGAISLGTSNTVATFTPATAWAATTEYHVVVVKGIRDTAGNALAATSVTSFTTGA